MHYDTVVYDIAIPPEFQSHANGSSKLECIQGDILDFETLNKAMRDCDVIFHTAAVADLDKTRSLPRQTMEVNVLGTANCLEAARNSKVKRFLFASSVYTAGKWGSFYRVSKQAGESLCKTFYEEFGLNYTILRYGSLYGRDANHWNFIYGVCKSLLTDGEFTYISSKDSVREYVHIFDAARETVRIAGDPDFSNKAVMITGHQRMKIEEFFTMLTEIIGKDVRIHYTPAEQHKHYVITPYSFEAEVPVRVNMSSYVDISEGILDCLRQVQNDIDEENRKNQCS
jgi:UDP-glucose 4-epimerase